MLPARRPPAWLSWLVFGGLAALTYPVRPWFELAEIISMFVGICSCVLMVVGIRRHRPADGWAWWMFAGGLFMLISGDLAYSIGYDLGYAMKFPSVPDAFYLSAVPLLALGLFRLSRDRWLPRSARLIDSAIIGVSLAIAYWVFVIGEIATDDRLPLLYRLVKIGYPIAGVVLCAVVAPMVVRSGRRTVSRWLLMIGSVITLACNVIYTLGSPDMTSTSRYVYSGYLISYTCWAAAALHPSMRTSATPVAMAEESFGRGRILLLAVSTMLVPAVLLIRRGDSFRNLGWLVIGLGSAVLMVLVLTRLAGFVTQVQQQAGRLVELAMRDDLTGLANRRSFEQHVTAALAAGSPQVAVIDLADFKNINDRLGRSAADRALVAVAERLTGMVREPYLIARVGGDEFALLIPDATAAEADSVARRVADGLRRPIVADGNELLLNVRVGISGGTGADAGELLRRADTALDAAKTQGSRYRRYDPELDAQADQAARLGAELRHALDDDEFRLVYQPIVTLPAGRTLAVEALVRWQHPVRGAVSPVEFIPVAERNGLIVELGAWIMRTACAQAAAWRAELGPDAPRYVSVNVSAHQLAQPDFAAFVATVLRQTGLAGRQLLVEVTETAIFGGGVAVTTLERLRELGVRIALDDFGTGHSSLGLLQNVPVDVLKVDKSFVDDITLSGRQSVIAEALIKVADGLGLDAVAEGVETPEQAAELHRLGYRLAQGFHFGRPVAQPDFSTAIERLPAA